MRSCSTSRTPSRRRPRARRAMRSRSGRGRPPKPTVQRIVVRINDAQSSAFAVDLQLLRDAHVSNVMLPKAESAAQVQAVCAAVPACPGARADRKRLRRRQRAAGGARRRRRPPGLRYARLRARSRPGHRRRPRGPRACRQRAGHRFARRGPGGTGRRRHAPARRRAAAAGRSRVVAAPWLWRQAVHPPAPGRAHPRRPRAERAGASTGPGVCWPPRPRHPAQPNSTAE